MADGASISQIQLSTIAEVTRGTTPASPAYQRNPINAGSFLEVNKNFEQSNLINPNRDPGARVGGVAGVQGNITMPLVKETGFEHWLKSALSASFAAITPVITGSFVASTKKFTRGTGSFLTDAITAKLEVGDAVWFGGTSANQGTSTGSQSASVTTINATGTDLTTILPAGGGVVRIGSEFIIYTGRTSTTLTGCTRGAFGTTAATISNATPILPVRVITAISATDLTFGNDVIADEASLSATLNTNVRVMVPGTTRSFYTVEQYFNDINVYEIYKGVEANTLAINIPTSGEANVAIAVLGTTYATGQVASSTYTATNSKTPMAGSVTGASLTVDGAALGTCLESAAININNNRALKYGVGNQFACFVEEGIRQIELTFAAYLVDLTMQTKFQNETRFALKITTVSADRDKYDFIFPRLVLTAAPKGQSGNTIVENYTAAAEKDTTTGSAFYVREKSAVGTAY